MRAAAALIVLALAGCGQDPAAPARANGACGAVEKPLLQGGQHLIGDREPPVPYSSTPPTSGWHASGAPPFGVAADDDPLTEPEQVSVLEAGGIVVTYRDLPPSDIATLEALAGDQVAVTSYDGLEPGDVALTAWGTLQRCAGVDVAAINAFVAAHRGGSEGTGTGGGGHGH